MNAYTVEDYRAAAKRAMAAGKPQVAEELAQAGMALQANPEGTGVGRGFVRGALQTAAAPAAMAATADITAMTDKARLASPEGQSGIAYEELVRAGVPQGAFASRAANTGSPQQNVAMMQQYGVSPLLQRNFSQVVDKRIENAQNVNVADASQRAAANLSFAGRMQDKAAALPQSPVAAEYAEALAEAPDTFKGWLGTITDNPVGFLAFAGETLAESGPAIGAGLATSYLTGNPMLGNSIMSMGGFSREYANEVSRFLQEKGIDLSDEDALKALLNNPEAMQEANQRGVTRGLVIALFEMAGQGAVASKIFGKTLARRTGSQMATEGGGEAAATAAVGDEVSIKDTLTEAVVGAGSAVPESVVAGKNKLFTSKGTLADPTTLEESYRGAAGDVARQLKEIATVNNYNLKDIGTGSNGARQALEDIRSSNVSRINLLRNSLKRQLDPKNAENLEDLVLLYAEAQAGIAAGKKKVSQKVISQQFDAIKQLVGPYKEGAQLLNELQKSNVITDLFKDGVKGGISQFTDYLSPFSQSGAVYDPSRMANVATGLILPAATGGSSIKVQAGGFALGRMIDAATGRRSRVARFVNKNLNSFGLPDPEGPSLVEQKALNEAQSKERRLAIAEVATALNAPKPGPLESMTLGTGLDRAGLETVVNKMAQDFANSPEFTPVLEDISKNLAGEGNRIDALTEIIPVIGAYAQQNTPELLVAPPDNPGLLRDFNMIAPERLTGIQTAAPQQPTQDPQQSGRQFTSPENYQAGIDANIELAETLQSTLSADPDVSVTDKGQLLSVLEGLKQPLTNSTVQLQTDIEALQRNDVSSEAIDKYVRPYLDRVTNQREQRSRLQQRVQDDRDLETDLSSPALPALSTPNPLQIPESDLQATNLPIMPSSEEIVSMREGSYKPDQKRTLVEAAEFLNNRWQAATGQTEPFEYTPENVDRISSMMATEAIEALKNDSNAIGWYDRKIKAAKAVTALVEPRIMQSPDAEAAFDFALAVTSNGQAVADNFAYTVEVFRYFMDNGKMPTDTWEKGGERNGAMVEAFNFFNAYNASGRNMPIQDFLSTDFTVAELDNLIKQFNAETGSTVSVPSSESRQASVKGSYIMGPKIGQGFYQNIRGNYDPLTMDIWWMRMWNRMVGRPFEASKDVDKNRARIREAVKTKNQTDLEKRLTKAALKDLAITRAALTDDEVLDQFVVNVESKYQSYYRKKSAELKGTGNKVPKPELFKASGTMVKNMKPQLQAQPKGPGERQYMREVTQAALAKLKSQGYPITTADFQALMWYPEKQLFRKLGVAPGRGADNDYLDAAKILAAKEGIPNERIEETLGTSGPDGAVASGASPTEAQGALRGDADRSGREETTADDREAPALSRFVNNGQSKLRRALSRRVPSKQEVVDQFPAVKALFEIGKKGSPYENGITNIEDALTLAKALGITVHMFNDHQKMLEAAGAGSKSIKGRFVKTSNGASGHVFALEPGTDYRGRNLTDIEALTTLLHEIFHGVTIGPMSGVGPMLNGNGNGTPSVENAIGAMIDKPQGKRTPQERKIMREITRLQNSLSAYVEGKPTERRPVRGLMAAMDSFDQQRNQMTPEEQMDFEDKLDAHVKYIRSKAEFSVDPFWVYAVNPKMAKLVMPETTKWIQGELRKAGNKDIQFFTHPLAISIAVVMALMASEQAEDEQREEQQRQQMQPGALSPTAGMLSAA